MDSKPLTPPRRKVRLAKPIKQQYESYSAIVNTLSLENELSVVGYYNIIPLIINKETKFVRAVNKNGQTVYIIIDTDGYIPENKEIKYVSTDESSLPYSLKIGALNVGGHDVTGVAFEYNKRICIVTKNDNFEPTEVNYVWAGDTDQLTELLVISHPVVKLSEIRAVPVDVLACTDSALRKLRNEMYMKLTKSFNERLTQVDLLKCRLKRFEELKNLAACQLTNTMNILENMHKCEHTIDEQKLIQTNLYLRNSGMTELLVGMQSLLNDTSVVLTMSNHIEDMNKQFEEMFSGLDKMI